MTVLAKVLLSAAIAGSGGALIISISNYLLDGKKDVGSSQTETIKETQVSKNSNSSYFVLQMPSGNFRDLFSPFVGSNSPNDNSNFIVDTWEII